MTFGYPPDTGGQMLSATLAGVATTAWINLLRLSTPKCAFIPKYHWFPFLCLVHLGIARPLGVLGRGRCIDDRRIDNRSRSRSRISLKVVPFLRQVLDK
jgi:hypothetical protein